MDYDNRIAECETLKQELDRFRPFDAELLDSLRKYFRVSLTYTSNALEGNTLTESETKVVLEDGITIGGKPMRDHLEAIGHAKAFDVLYSLLDREASETDLLMLHRLVLDGISETVSGEYRTKQVVITGTEYLPPDYPKVPQLMARFFKELLPTWKESYSPVEVAARAHLELVTIHPFTDGNGRTARLLMNLLLLKSGYGPTIIPPILRGDYIALLRIAQVENNPLPFISFISDRVYESLKETIRLVKHLKAV
ncbi:MAG: Fic family protein [Vampirovibrionales bacterium]|nr:Fic family protein [Vampirovibrionales bacterium]